MPSSNWTPTSGPFSPSRQPATTTTTAETYPVTQPASPVTEAPLRHHDQCLAREQQQMMEQLMSSGLVQAADLVAFGFTEAEITAAGFHLPQAHHTNEEEGGAVMTAARRTPQRGAARKRSGRPDEDGDGSSVRPAGTPPAPSPATATRSFAGAAPRTAAKAVEGRHDGRKRPDMGVAATSADVCARVLRYDDAESGCAQAPRAVRTTNTALGFSGLDVAVAKEIALLLQTPADEDAKAEQARMREYLESREEGNTPYM